jgi:hypothetical protein
MVPVLVSLFHTDRISRSQIKQHQQQVVVARILTHYQYQVVLEQLILTLNTLMLFEQRQINYGS